MELLFPAAGGFLLNLLIFSLRKWQSKSWRKAFYAGVVAWILSLVGTLLFISQGGAELFFFSMGMLLFAGLSGPFMFFILLSGRE